MIWRCQLSNSLSQHGADCVGSASKGQHQQREPKYSGNTEGRCRQAKDCHGYHDKATLPAKRPDACHYQCGYNRTDSRCCGEKAIAASANVQYVLRENRQQEGCRREEGCSEIKGHCLYYDGSFPDEF